MLIAGWRSDMTDFLAIEGRRIAFDVAGEGPLIVLAHGIGDRRQAYRFLAPALVRAGFRVAAMDMRGHGEASPGDWKSITRTDVAGGQGRGGQHPVRRPPPHRGGGL